MKIVKLFLIGLSLLCFGAAVVAFDTAVSVQNEETTYQADLIAASQTEGNHYEWIWTVSNPSPGNGSGSTLQDLSHWSIAADHLSQSHIVSVSYSLDGISWTELPMVVGTDKSQNCYTGAVLKFDYGTYGSDPTYYKLVVNTSFSQTVNTANFKSGKITGCYNGYVTSLGTHTGSGPME